MEKLHKLIKHLGLTIQDMSITLGTSKPLSLDQLYKQRKKAILLAESGVRAFNL